jgi:uracil-DNA glycosylase
VKLQSVLRKQLAGWRKDLAPCWRKVVSDVELGFEHPGFDCEARAGEILVPGRKGSAIPGSPRDAHIFRSLDRIAPKEVRVVILGQDPYPKLSWATGRAFEQGNLDEWPENPRLIAASLRRIVQVVARTRTGRRAYIGGDAGWKALVKDCKHSALDLESPRQLFDHLENEGVLLLNTSFTVGIDSSSGKPTSEHFALWRPLLRRVLISIASQRNRGVVFLLWGRHASEVFEHEGIRAGAERIGGGRIAAVSHPHPAAITRQGAIFLQPPNPLLAANRILKNWGVAAIHW